MKRKTKDTLIKLVVYILFPILFWCAIIGLALMIDPSKPIMSDTISEVMTNGNVRV